MEVYKISYETKDTLKKYLKQNNYRACELSFGNNLLWSPYYDISFMIVCDMLVFCKMHAGRLALASYPIGDGDEKRAFDEIVRLFREDNMPFKMYLVSESAWTKIESWYGGLYTYTSDRDEADYLYEYETLANLKGKKLHGKRNHINYFEENYPNYIYEKINSSNKQECMGLARKWFAESEEDADGKKKFELSAIETALDNMEDFGLDGALIRVDSGVCGFTIGEELTNDTFVIHFEKADANIRGAYPIINREFVRRELSKYQYINREEDMGVPGLRHAKTTYQPVSLVEKGYVSSNADKVY